MNRPSSRELPKLVSETVAAEEASDPGASQSARTPAPNPYLPGEVIGDRYRLVREIGRGGMGVVWVAHSLVLGVDVALKLLRANAGDSGVSSRMAREAHAAARLGHPALVRVFDFGWTSRGDPYLVMELVAGETVSALLAREMRIDAIRAVQMILPIADGLRVAHDKHIIHRDIKPDNIFLATDTFGRTQPKLLDFGIAKIDVSAHDGKLTQVGVVLGSPEYMSPEQAVGAEDVDERSDVWSLSVVLYELVTGTVPFSRANYNALMQAIIHDEPTPMPDHAAGDAALWQVVGKGLTKDREDRWANMTEFGEALALWLYDHGIKEDLSGNSIRAVWLDGALSGVRHDVRSSVPAWRVGAAVQVETKPHEAAQRPTWLSGHFARRIGLKSRWHTLAMAGLSFALVALAVVLVVMLRSNALSAPPAVTSTPEPIQSVAAGSTAPVLGSAIVAPSDSSLAASAGLAAGTPTDSNGSAESSESKRAPVRPSTTKSSKRTSKRTHDFGF
jgi:serine/threonine-protein kinase